jgi:hypothetical protein
MPDVDGRGRVDVSGEAAAGVECRGLRRGEAVVGRPDVDQSIAGGLGLSGVQVGVVEGRVAGFGGRDCLSVEDGQVRAVRGRDAGDQVAVAGQVLRHGGVLRRGESESGLEDDDGEAPGGNRNIGERVYSHVAEARLGQAHHTAQVQRGPGARRIRSRLRTRAGRSRVPQPDGQFACRAGTWCQRVGAAADS